MVYARVKRMDSYLRDGAEPSTMSGSERRVDLGPSSNPGRITPEPEAGLFGITLTHNARPVELEHRSRVPSVLSPTRRLSTWTKSGVSGKNPPAGCSLITGSRLQPDLVVDRLPQPLLTTEVAFRRFHRNVTNRNWICSNSPPAA